MPTPVLVATSPSPRPAIMVSAGARLLRTSEPQAPQAQPAACAPLTDTAAAGRRPRRAGVAAGAKAIGTGREGESPGCEDGSAHGVLCSWGWKPP